MSRAIDIDFPAQPKKDKRDDGERCDKAKNLLVDKAEFQIGWHGNNKKPSSQLVLDQHRSI
jgi:hypothetical protein